MALWLDVHSAIALALLALVIPAYAVRIWRTVRHNDEPVAGGLLSNQVFGAGNDVKKGSDS